MATNFASYASRLLSQSSTEPGAPLFYSTRDSFLPFTPDDDILGASVESSADGSRREGRTGRALSFGVEDEEEEGEEQPTASMLGVQVPAFMSRLSQAPGRFASRGWRTHESVLPPQHSVYLDEEEDEDDLTDEEGDSSPPGAFLSTPLHRPPSGSTTEPLLAPRTLFVYPVPGSASGGGVRAQGEYRDSHWIVIYGLAVILVLVLGVVEWWKSPKVSCCGLAWRRLANRPHTLQVIPPSTPLPGSSIFSALPILLILSFISLLAGFTSATYILAVRHSMRHFIHAALLGGPLLFIGCGVVAFAGSFGGSGVAGDSGWKAGMRWFAVGCFALAYVLGRAAISRRKQVARAIAIGEVSPRHPRWVGVRRS